MVLLGLGVLIVSILFLSYHRPPRAWLHSLTNALRTPARQQHDPSDRKPSKPQTPLTSASPEANGREKSKDAGRPPPAPPTIMPPAEDDDDEQATPKASAVNATPAAADVPTLSLAAPEPDSARDTLPAAAPSFNIQPSPASMMPPPSRPSKPSSSALMPPPSARPSALRPLPRANGLSPAPSRGGAPNSLMTAARSGTLTAASTSTLPPASRPSRKVTLAPGHSPLDWATLCRKPPTPTFLRGADVPPDGCLVRVSPSQLKVFNGRKGRDAWGTYLGKVYNLTPYKDFHPGGPAELYKGAGRVGETERLFKEVHPWVNWDGMLGECLVGVLVGEGEGDGEKGGRGGVDLEAVD